MMTGVILSMYDQIRLFVILTVFGAAAGVIYDLIRAIRRILRHSIITVQIEDLVFWLVFTISVMLVMLWENNAAVRFFSVVAPLIGMLLYFCTLSKLIISLFVYIFSAIIKVIMIILHIFCVPMEIVGKTIGLFINKLKIIIYKFNKIIKKLLKNSLKCETMSKRIGVRSLRYHTNDNGSDKVEGRSQEKRKK
jgi:spore cortex biosynthesis protein YabQ